MTLKDLCYMIVLQACETDNDTLASEASSRIVEQLYELLSYCGELNISTGDCPTLLTQTEKRNSIDELLTLKHHRDDDLLNIKVRGASRSNLVSKGFALCLNNPVVPAI